MDKKYNVVVVGAGHAGCEAALAAARMGLKTLIITLNMDSVARMPCNPAIGGIGKGQIVREIDALGGEMAWITDNTGIQFKMLNISRGPAVWSPRAQCDKEAYSILMSRSIQNQQNLDILQSEASSLIIKNGKAAGVKTVTGDAIEADAVIITTGTFLKGRIYVGDTNFEGGRFNEKAASYLSRSLIEDCGIKLSRFKTSTPARINSKTVDYSKMAEHPGDENPRPFSHFTVRDSWRKNLRSVSCWLTYTNPISHKLVSDNLDKSSLNIGDTNSQGPRYCPSIEDKIVRFPDRQRHQIFLEPEGLSTNEVYLNGLYTGLPFDIQQKMINSIEGLENAKVIRYGYAIEYDYSNPLQIKNTLETKNVENLYFAGQINGTTGYEEAAAQGLMAGINAGLKLFGREPLILGRQESYIGVMLDDLTSKGVDEPYRMFTSRAEYRLMIRSDNADIRLMRIGHSVGLLSDAIYKKFELYVDALTNIYNNETGNMPEDKDLLPWTLEQAKEEVDIYKKYEGYIKIQQNMANKIKKNEDRKIPEDFDYNGMSSLSSETKERLSTVKPQTLGQASRIPGIKPSDIAIITVYLEKQKRRVRS
ncbi:MAG: tRNA uridine-5-carboxymethylaminomethyl(34) synthesis enzyme MnmG [Endomicrobia bacterium]|nr:tRNA uridine-5-carboxymethylaminomethyl(34) synthesis enzyme MnmG [Bacillota bacterium]MCL1972840.1 tRNA uridine-5-carboxymethylaminomethyl(34) synthesis enzyme MnmG [Endomicrobiia bacterium]